MKHFIFILTLCLVSSVGFGYAGRSQFLILPAKDLRFQTSVSNLNYKATVTSSQGESESSITGFSQNFGVIYSFVEGQQLSFGSSYVNSESKVRSKRTSADIRTDVTGLGNLDLAYQGATQLEYADVFYGLSYNFKHQGKVIRESGVNQFEANAVQAQNSWTPSIGIALPTVINLTFGGDLSHSIKEDGDVRLELSSSESITTKERQGNVTSMMGFMELDIEYLPFISLRRTHYAEQVSETTASNLRFSSDAYDADTVTVGATLPLSENLKIEPRFSHTKFIYEDSSDFSISDAEQTSLNVGVTLMF